MPLHTMIMGRCSCDDPSCASPGKHPLTLHGLKDATTDEATIRRWWTEAPQANVGIATGPESGFFMVGPDGQQGLDALATLQLQHGSLPRTPRAISGSRAGEHYYLAWPAGGHIKNSRNHNGLPIDVRGQGGLVVAPPSLHSSGAIYTWFDPPEEIPVAPAPEWLLDWVRSGKGTAKTSKGESDERTGLIFTVEPDKTPDARQRAVAYLERCPPAISHQGGHNLTFTVARAIVYGFDLGPEVGYELLAKHYNPRCAPPWSEKELRHKCEEAHTQPFDKPRGYLLAEGDGQDGLSDLSSFFRNLSEVDSAVKEDIEALPIPPPVPWPVLAPQARHGLAGEIVETLAPETESDLVAILGQALLAFGSAVGRGPHYMVEGDSHHTNLFACLVGESSRGRKGTSRGRIMQVMSCADSAWCDKCVASGLSSGEGLIWAVRDPIEITEPIKSKGRITGYQKVVKDEGVEDKRLLANEGEFAMVLRVMQREGNSLSPTIRQAWDTGNLRTLVKNNPARATGAHISIAGHITRPELTKYLKDNEALNGFANRFLWLCVRRSQLLPDGGRSLDVSPLGTRLNYALASARNVAVMQRSVDATTRWHEVYPLLTAERSGLYGAVTSRAEAQVLRLSMIYALLDLSPVIRLEHLEAALAFWAYCDASAKLIFGAEPEDPLIPMVRQKLQEAVEGLTRTQLHAAFNRHIPAQKLLEALAKLRDRGEVRAEPLQTGGRPAERWRVVRKNELSRQSVPKTPSNGLRGGERSEESPSFWSDPTSSFVRSHPTAQDGAAPLFSFVRSPSANDVDLGAEKVVTL